MEVSYHAFTVHGISTQALEAEKPFTNVGREIIVFFQQHLSSDQSRRRYLRHALITRRPICNFCVVSLSAPDWDYRINLHMVYAHIARSNVLQPFTARPPTQTGQRTPKTANTSIQSSVAHSMHSANELLQDHSRKTVTTIMRQWQTLKPSL